MTDAYIDVMLLQEELHRLTEQNVALKKEIERLKEMLKDEDEYD